MKLIILFVFVGSAGMSFGQCNPFFEFNQGDRWVHETYDSTKSLVRKIEGEINSLEKIGDKSWKAGVDFTYGNVKDTEPHKGNVEIKCENGIVKTDFSRFLTGAIYRDTKDNVTDITSTRIEWPPSLAVGDKLSDANLTLDAKTMKMGLTLSGRKVVSQDTLNLSIGEFVVFRVEYDIKLLGLKEERLKGIDYVAEKLGVIRSEIYEKNGDLREYSEITRFTGY